MVLIGTLVDASFVPEIIVRVEGAQLGYVSHSSQPTYRISNWQHQARVPDWSRNCSSAGETGVWSFGHDANCLPSALRQLRPAADM